MPVKSHGETKWINGRRITTPEYRVWQAMRNRCLNHKSQDYKYYGGRGITIQQSWGLFQNFLRDMGRRPSVNHTLDRIDGSKGYSKFNCRWATRKEQSRNRTYCRLDIKKAAQIRASDKTQVQLAKEYGVSQPLISQILLGKAWV